MFELWGIALSAVVLIVTIVLFFNKLQTSISRLCEDVTNVKTFLSEEHKRHDEKLSKELLSMTRALEKHISSEEIEGALQARSREDLAEVVKNLNDIKCKIK